MKGSICFSYSFFSAVLFFCIPVRAQNIINDTIVVSTGEAVTLKFQADPEGKIPDGNGLYEISGAKKALLIKAREKEAKDQLLIVKEGDRRHEFILTYAEKAPVLLVDRSNKKRLNVYVDSKKKKASDGLAEADVLFDKGEYDGALAKYTRLIHDVEETEREPIRLRIEECDQRGQAGRQKKFKDVMTRADAHAAARRFREADAGYGEALILRPDDVEVQTKRQANSVAWYKDYSRKGDSAASANNCLLARTLFEEAKQARPADFKKYYDKIYSRMITCATEQAYTQQKRMGDDALQTEAFDEAKAAYDSALQLRKEDTYIIAKLKKLKEAQETATAVKAKEAEYYAILLSAKKLAIAKDFNAAVEAYKRAGKLFGARRFPKERIEALMKLKNAATAKR